MDVRPMGTRIREHRHYAAVLDGFRNGPLKGKAGREHTARLDQLLAETGIDYATVMRVVRYDKEQQPQQEVRSMDHDGPFELDGHLFRDEGDLEAWETYGGDEGPDD